MKNFKKVLAVMTAAASLVMSTSALAADNEVAFNASTDEYSTGLAGSYAEGKFTVSGTPTVSAGTEMTLLILKEGTDEANVTNDDILYIDQVTEGTEGAFTGMGLKTDIALAVTEADGHIVKLGYKDSAGTFRIAEGNIIVTAVAEEDTGITVLWGDINQDDGVTVEDAADLVTALTGGGTEFGDFTVGTEFVTGYLWGDINLVDDVTVEDAADLVTALTGGGATFGDFTVGERELVSPATVTE